MNTEMPAAGRRIANRFELAAAFADSYDDYAVSTWRAIDTVLSRELRAVVIPHDHPHRTLAIDAARKAGLFDDPHTCAVLSVVDDDTDSVFFTEFPIGTRLDRYVHGEPLPPDAATAIIGETTSVINHARHQGLRHLQLNASHIFISDAGELMLDGIATMAGLAGAPTDALSTDLDRSETRGLLVFYAALLSGQDFPADPNTHQGLIQSMAERTDLPDRVRDVFQSETAGQGPRSPADLLRRIVPWGDIDVTRLPEQQPDDPSVSDESASSDFAALESVSPDSISTTATDTDSDHSDIDVYESAVEASASGDDSAQSAEASESTAESEEAAGNAADISATDGDDRGDDFSPQWSQMSDSPAEVLDSQNPDLAQPEERLNVAPPSHTLPSYTVHLDSAVYPDQVDSLPRALPHDTSRDLSEGGSDSAAEATETAQAAAETAEHEHYEKQGADSASGPIAGSIPEDFVGIDESDAAARTRAAHFAELPSEAVVATGSSHIRVSTAVMALFTLGVIIALVAGVAKLLSPLDPVQVTPPDGDSASQSQKAPAENGASTPSPSVTSPPQIKSVTFVSADPNIKDDPSAPRLFEDASLAADGKPSTVFQSWFFTNPQLSETDQFGLLIQLTELTDVSSVTLTTTGEGGNIQWRAYDQAHPTRAEVITQKAVNKSTTLSSPQKVSTDRILIWVTQMPVDESGRNLLRISEISVK
ncbi:MAG: hypothetical protein PUK59_03530 [Actinomycetaceae bacterium]|nr:hypothetical protein [Actinomycetaceae bacterium]MDY5854413.1 hypothetical protein [Arcanobacterium sp.]